MYMYIEERDAISNEGKKKINNHDYNTHNSIYLMLLNVIL